MTAMQETIETITISRDVYERLQETVKRQLEEIEALEYRIKTLSECA